MWVALILAAIFIEHLYLHFLTFYICFNQIKYKAEGKKEFNNYSIVTDTPVYVTAILGHTWASEVQLQ